MALSEANRKILEVKWKALEANRRFWNGEKTHKCYQYYILASSTSENSLVADFRSFAHFLGYSVNYFAILIFLHTFALQFSILLFL
jgi:hypothetical protein